MWCSPFDAKHNQTCFEDSGDKFYVYDGTADGASAAADWWTDYGRFGTCWNSLGAGKRAECNYDMREGGTVYWQTCYQDRSALGIFYCDPQVYSSLIGG